MSKRNINVAVIGCGGIASFHCDILRDLDNVNLLGVYDKNIERAQAFAAERGMTAYHSMAELLASDATAVAICTPSGLHAEQTVACLDAGKHVIVEKPIAITEEGCQAILEAEQRSGKFCAPISQLRFYPDIRRAKEIIEKELLGKPVLCDLYMKYYREPSYYAGSWKGTKAMDGGGALMNQGLHGIDALHFIMGDMIQVSGTVRTQAHAIEVEDTAVATVHFRNGALGVIEGTTSVQPGYPRRMEFHCEHGSLILEENKIIACDLPDFVLNTDAPKVKSFRNPFDFPLEGHRAQYENILAAIEGRETLFYTAQEGAKTVRTILGIYRSSEEERNIRL